MALVVTDTQQIIVGALNGGDVAAVDGAFHPDCRIHLNGGPERELTLSEFKDALAGMLAAFPDLQFEMNDQFVDGDRVATHGPPGARTTARSGRWNPPGGKSPSRAWSWTATSTGRSRTGGSCGTRPESCSSSARCDGAPTLGQRCRHAGHDDGPATPPEGGEAAPVSSDA